MTKRVRIRGNEQIDLVRILCPQSVPLKLLSPRASAEDPDRKERLEAEFVHVLQWKCRHVLRSGADSKWRVDENEPTEWMGRNVGLGDERVQAICTE